MSTRKLRLVWVEDATIAVETDVVRQQLPVDVAKQYSGWRDFVVDLQNNAIPDFDLLTVDCNFNEDRSSPPFPTKSEWVTVPDYQQEEMLKNLQWSTGLRAKNSGILIGATLVTRGTMRDAPIGAELYTLDPDLVATDIPSAMLVTQIYAACDVDEIDLSATHKLLSWTLSTIRAGARSCQDALPKAVCRFRRALVERAGLNRAAKRRKTTIWFTSDSLTELLNIFDTVATDDELRAALNETGVEFVNRDLITENIDIRSLLLDKLVHRDHLQHVIGLRPITIQDVRQSGMSKTGDLPIRDFIGYLQSETNAQIDEIEKFLGSKTGRKPDCTINRTSFSSIQKLYALLFAWCDEYMDQWERLKQPWDPMTRRSDNKDFPACEIQMRSLLKVIRDAVDRAEHDLATTLIPLHHSGTEISVMRAVEAACKKASDHPLSRVLRYESYISQRTKTPAKKKATDIPANTIAKRRRTAVSGLLDRLEASGCVKKSLIALAGGSEKVPHYTVLGSLPKHPSVRVSRQAVHRRLGFTSEDGTNDLTRIIVNAGIPIGLQFFDSLDSGWLPGHLQQLCEDHLLANCSHFKKAFPKCVISRPS